MRTAALLLAMAATLGACMPRQGVDQQATNRSIDLHTSRNSLDWAGTYEGVLPCADCPGIRTTLTLRSDDSFELSSVYLERQVPPRTERGQFTWAAGGNAITLDARAGGQQFAVGEGSLTQLDMNGAPSGPSSANRVLKRVGPAATATSPAEPGAQGVLQAHRWTLESAVDGQGRRIERLQAGAGRTYVFTFAQTRINIEGGCNRLFGPFQIDADGRLKVDRLASTMMACEPAAMQADSALSDLLAQPMKVDLATAARPALRLVSATGETLVLSGQLTPEARYGAPTLVFLEVAAQPVECSRPPAGSTKCLQVRERRYDDQGLVVGTPGPWLPLQESIEGFTHQAGVRSVLRVKRFQRSGAAGAGAGQSFVYVLDLIVESELVKP